MQRDHALFHNFQCQVHMSEFANKRLLFDFSADKIPVRVKISEEPLGYYLYGGSAFQVQLVHNGLPPSRDMIGMLQGLLRGF